MLHCQLSKKKREHGGRVYFSKICLFEVGRTHENPGNLKVCKKKEKNIIKVVFRTCTSLFEQPDMSVDKDKIYLYIKYIIHIVNI